jgi:hypothetical protein
MSPLFDSGKKGIHINMKDAPHDFILPCSPFLLEEDSCRILSTLEDIKE